MTSYKKNEMIQKLKSNALNFDQLRNLAGPEVSEKCRWLEYDDILKYQSLQQLMSLGACVILLEIESRVAPKVGHFILLLDHGDHYEHFDSYGLNMDEERAITQEHHLTNIFKNSRKPIVDNSKKLQALREDINTCGRWVVARLLLRDLELGPFIQLLNYFHVNYDDLISIMTLLLQFKK